MEKNKSKSRREFINDGMRLSLALALGGIGGLSLSKVIKDDYVWQIDPFLCTQCGRCATECVLSPSAVKCVHALDVCGYCC